MPANLIFVGIDFLLPHRTHWKHISVFSLTDNSEVYINSYLALCVHE
jgi:hypothetical protein